MATPLRQGGANGVMATPLRAGAGATPLRTPRDTFAINQDGSRSIQTVGSTPRDIKLREQAMRTQLKSQYVSSHESMREIY